MAAYLSTLRFHRHWLLAAGRSYYFLLFLAAACGKKDDPSVPHAIGPEPVK